MKNTVRALSDYMKQRAAFEKVEWQLTESYLQRYFKLGTRCFFGVTVDKDGSLLSDEQQPVFFRKYHAS